LTVAAALRVVFPTADPPWRVPVGITWHDEGPWVHNARNKVLWGEWSLDRWNPMYLTPVFTGLEYAAFSTFGVGQWQARVVSQVMGLIAVAAIGLGVAAIASRRTGLLAAALVATNYVGVMWDRVALMEATMTAFIAIAWGAYAAAQRRPAWGILAGSAAVLAFFTKAAAAFFIAAIGMEVTWALLSWIATCRPGLKPRPYMDGAKDGPSMDGAKRGPSVDGAKHGPSMDGASSAGPGLQSNGGDHHRPIWGRGFMPRPTSTTLETTQARAALWTIAGLALAGGVFLFWFVVPHWTEFRFYNWEMSVTRKPAYGLSEFVDRASWLPAVNDFFTRMWLATVVTLAGCLALLGRWRTIEPGERLLLLWIGLGVAELVVHDAGNQRRLIFFIPAFAAVTALVLGSGGRWLAGLASIGRRALTTALPILLYASYIVAAPIVRLTDIYEVRPAVRGGALAAVLLTVLLVSFWPRIRRWVARQRWSFAAAATVVAIVITGDLVQFWQWAAGRTYKNVEASRLIGRLLPPGTLVQGKLANGLALENRIKPIFVGRGFGNYHDRLSRDDVRYVLTYVTPRPGFEGPVILDVLDALPEWHILRTFDVAETSAGHDRAALIEKGPRGPAIPTTELSRAHD
jgi:hypothetical protein